MDWDGAKIIGTEDEKHLQRRLLKFWNVSLVQWTGMKGLFGFHTPRMLYRSPTALVGRRHQNLYKLATKRHQNNIMWSLWRQLQKVIRYEIKPHWSVKRLIEYSLGIQHLTFMLYFPNLCRNIEDQTKYNKTNKRGVKFLVVNSGLKMQREHKLKAQITWFSLILKYEKQMSLSHN